MAEQATLTDVVVIPELLRPRDCCDRHPTAAAYVVAMFNGLPLLFCSHCFALHEAKIRELTDQIRDERHILLAAEGRPRGQDD